MLWTVTGQPPRPRPSRRPVRRAAGLTRESLVDLSLLPLKYLWFCCFYFKIRQPTPAKLNSIGAFSLLIHCFLHLFSPLSKVHLVCWCVCVCLCVCAWLCLFVCFCLFRLLVKMQLKKHLPFLETGHP